MPVKSSSFFFLNKQGLKVAHSASSNPPAARTQTLGDTYLWGSLRNETQLGVQKGKDMVLDEELVVSLSKGMLNVPDTFPICYPAFSTSPARNGTIWIEIKFQHLDKSNGYLSLRINMSLELETKKNFRKQAVLERMWGTEQGRLALKSYCLKQGWNPFYQRMIKRHVIIWLRKIHITHF